MGADRDYVWWVTCPEHGSQQPRPVFLSDGVTPRLLYGGGMSVDSPKGYDYQRGYCPVCAVVCPLRSVSTPRGGKRKGRKPLERCTGKCLGGSLTGSCECECRGRCHGAGVCTCGAQRARESVQRLNPGDDNLRALERAALASPGDAATQQAYVTAALRARAPISTFVLANMARQQHSAIVFKPNGKAIKVKNLGWLLKHAGKNIITLIEVVAGPAHHAPVELVVRFDDGHVYVTDYASRTVLWWFLDRPLFYDVPAVWHDPVSGTSLPGKVTKGMSAGPQHRAPGQWAPPAPGDDLRLNPDESRRGRERRARLEGGVAGEVARLTDEIRAGLLPPDRVMYAAALGDEAARATVPDLLEAWHRESAWYRNRPGAPRPDEIAVTVTSVADSLRWVPWGREIADAAWNRSMGRLNAVVSPHVGDARIAADRSVVAMTQGNYGEALDQAAYAYAVASGEQNAVSWRGASLEEFTRQAADLVALLLQRPLPDAHAINPPGDLVPSSRQHFLPALALSGRLPRGEYVPPVTSFELATSGASPLVYVPEGSYEHAPANDALAALITTPGALAAPGAWDDLIARVGTRGTVYLIDRRGEQWRVRDVVYYPGGRDGALDVEHLGRRGRIQVDLRQAYGHVLPVLVYKPLRANPPRGDERLRDLYRQIEAGAPLGDFSAFPALMTELQRANRLAPWGADYGVLLLWQGLVTGTSDTSLPRVGQTVEATAVIQARIGAGGWSDPRVDVLIPVTGARGPGWATAWDAAGIPPWVKALRDAPRLLPKPPRAKRKRA